MGDTSALRALRDKVVAGDIVTLLPFNAAFPTTDRIRTEANMAFDAYHGSLDAAKALHEAVLPEWHFMLEDCRPDDVAKVELGSTIKRDTGIDGDMPLSRLWLLAILDALIQEAGE